MLKNILNFFGFKNSQQVKDEPANEILQKKIINSKSGENWTDESSQFQKDFRERESRIPANMKDDTKDYLGMAATAKNEAANALEYNQFDLAWKIEHERIKHYTNHGLKNGYRHNEILGLLSLVYQSLSHILEKEGKPLLSLAFYLYSVQCSGCVNEGVEFNLRGICRRNKLKHLKNNIDDFLKACSSKERKVIPDLKFCQSEVERWQSEAPFHSEDVQEMIKHYLTTEGYLSLVNGVTKNIEKSLVENNIHTIEVLKNTESDELIKIKGIGKVALVKIYEATAFL